MRIPPKPKPEPGEWQTEVNQWGGVRRYRMIGNIKEYEMQITTTTCGTITESQLEAYNKAAPEREAKQKAEIERQRKAVIQRRSCPFHDDNKNYCICEACALFIDGCTLAKFTPAKDTEGLQCPLSKYKTKCRKDCALYKNGCTLTGIKEI